MLCQECGKRPATVHLTKIHNNQSSEVHLCETCALEKGEINLGGEPHEALQHFLAGLLSMGAAFEGDPGPVCSSCGLTYREFARSGRLGCPECYSEFQVQLQPLIRRLQGQLSHNGKIPARRGSLFRRQREVRELRNELKERIAREEFERAAEIRDLLRSLERDEGGGSDGSVGTPG